MTSFGTCALCISAIRNSKLFGVQQLMENECWFDVIRNMTVQGERFFECVCVCMREYSEYINSKRSNQKN